MQVANYAKARAANYRVHATAAGTIVLAVGDIIWV